MSSRAWAVYRRVQSGNNAEALSLLGASWRKYVFVTPKYFSVIADVNDNFCLLGFPSEYFRSDNNSLNIRVIETSFYIFVVLLLVYLSRIRTQEHLNTVTRTHSVNVEHTEMYLMKEKDEARGNSRTSSDTRRS